MDDNFDFDILSRFGESPGDRAPPSQWKNRYSPPKKEIKHPKYGIQIFSRIQKITINQHHTAYISNSTIYPPSCRCRPPRSKKKESKPSSPSKLTYRWHAGHPECADLPEHLFRYGCNVRREHEFSGPSLLCPESEDGCVEYKLRISLGSQSRFQQLATQLKFRLSEGGGRCFYYIGVEDNGHPRGLDEFDLSTSLEAMTAIAAEVGAQAIVIRMPPGREGRRCAVVLVLARSCHPDGSREELRVVLAGSVDSGKSTLMAVLTHGAEGSPSLDNGRGSARMSVLRHKHEIETGRTSSINHRIASYSKSSNLPLNYKSAALSFTPREIMNATHKMVRFYDVGGHERCMKTTLHGMTCSSPDCLLLCVCASAGVSWTTKEHLAAALALGVPAAVVLTKVDLEESQTLEMVVRSVRALISSCACTVVDGADSLNANGICAGDGNHCHHPSKAPHSSDTRDDDYMAPIVESEERAAEIASLMNQSSQAICGRNCADGEDRRLCVIPLFKVSSTTGQGISVLHAFLHALDPGSSPSCSSAMGLSGDVRVVESPQVGYPSRVSLDQNPSDGSHITVSCTASPPPQLPRQCMASPSTPSTTISTFTAATTTPSTMVEHGSRLSHHFNNNNSSSSSIQSSDRPCLNDQQQPHFQIENSFFVQEVGPVLSGIVVSGSIAVGDSLLLGPQENGGFKKVRIVGVHQAQVDVPAVHAGQHATLAIQESFPSSLMSPSVSYVKSASWPTKDINGNRVTDECGGGVDGRIYHYNQNNNNNKDVHGLPYCLFNQDYEDDGECDSSRGSDDDDAIADGEDTDDEREDTGLDCEFAVQLLRRTGSWSSTSSLHGMMSSSPVDGHPQGILLDLQPQSGIVSYPGNESSSTMATPSNTAPVIHASTTSTAVPPHHSNTKDNDDVNGNTGGATPHMNLHHHASPPPTPSNHSVLPPLPPKTPQSHYGNILSTACYSSPDSEYSNAIGWHRMASSPPPSIMQHQHNQHPPSIMQHQHNQHGSGGHFCNGNERGKGEGVACAAAMASASLQQSSPCSSSAVDIYHPAKYKSTTTPADLESLGKSWDFALKLSRQSTGSSSLYQTPSTLSVVTKQRNVCDGASRHPEMRASASSSPQSLSSSSSTGSLSGPSNGGNTKEGDDDAVVYGTEKTRSFKIIGRQWMTMQSPRTRKGTVLIDPGLTHHTCDGFVAIILPFQGQDTSSSSNNVLLHAGGCDDGKSPPLALSPAASFADSSSPCATSTNTGSVAKRSLVVHCGGVRQAAHLVSLREINHLGADGGDGDNDGGAGADSGVQYTASGDHMDLGKDHSNDACSGAMAKNKGVDGDGELVDRYLTPDIRRGCLAAARLLSSHLPEGTMPERAMRAEFRFVHLPEFMLPGSKVLLRDHSSGRMVGAGVVISTLVSNNQ